MLFQVDSVLGPSEAAPDTFSKTAVSLDQVKRHLTLFQVDGVLGPREAAPD